MFVWIHSWSVLLWGFFGFFFDNYNNYYVFLLCFVLKEQQSLIADKTRIQAMF